MFEVNKKDHLILGENPVIVELQPESDATKFIKGMATFALIILRSGENNGEQYLKLFKKLKANAFLSQEEVDLAKSFIEKHVQCKDQNIIFPPD